MAGPAPYSSGDGFLAAYEEAADRLFGCLERACDSPLPWPARAREAVRAALALLADDLELAGALLSEGYAHGPVVQAHHEGTLARLATLLRDGREEAEEPLLPEQLEEGLVGGALFLAGRPVRRGEPEGLIGLAPQITALLLTPYIGREEAARVADEAP